jgi:aminopeptidase N
MAPISGGMEHQTMTTQGFFEKGLTSHELGHQWWGDNVTCASWSDVWVNEGFASYSECLMLEYLYAGQQIAHMSDIHSNVMSQPNGSTWVLDSLNESRIFSSRLTYDKGAAIIHSLRYLVNDDALFFQTLRNFQQDFADSMAKGVDIQHAFEVATGLDLAPYFEQWYFGEGYPTYSLKWNEFGNDILLQLSHTVSLAAVTPTFTNPIDVRIVRQSQADTIVRLDINSNLDQFYFPGIGDATSMTIDPQNWIINKVGTVQFDPNLLGIEQATIADDLVLYPNPSNGVYTVRFAQKGEFDYTVYQMNGKVLDQGKVSDGQTIDLHAAQSGSYLIEIGTRKKLVTVAH